MTRERRTFSPGTRVLVRCLPQVEAEVTREWRGQVFVRCAEFGEWPVSPNDLREIVG